MFTVLKEGSWATLVTYPKGPTCALTENQVELLRLLLHPARVALLLAAGMMMRRNVPEAVLRAIPAKK